MEAGGGRKGRERAPGAAPNPEKSHSCSRLEPGAAPVLLIASYSPFINPLFIHSNIKVIKYELTGKGHVCKAPRQERAGRERER